MTAWQNGQVTVCAGASGADREEAGGPCLGEREPWCLTTLHPGVRWTVRSVERSVITQKDSAKREERNRMALPLDVRRISFAGAADRTEGLGRGKRVMVTGV